MSESSSLKSYQQKRDFSRSPEPAQSSKSSSKLPQFVIQKHDASSLHYDFRLEVGNVLKSWAIPKGPSTDPRDKRLALPTEDHPLDYVEFEGVIPEGEYGAGSVLVWDTGAYHNLKHEDESAESMAEAMEQAISNGHIEVWLEGKKIQGGYALTRIATGKSERWLLIKMKDEAADARRNPVSTEPNSVLSGRSLDEIA